MQLSLSRAARTTIRRRVVWRGDAKWDEAAAPLAARHVPAPQAPLQETLPPGKPVIQRDLVERVVAEMPKGEIFSPTSIAAAEGRVRVVRKGTSHREATYTRA